MIQANVMDGFVLVCLVNLTLLSQLPFFLSFLKKAIISITLQPNLQHQSTLAHREEKAILLK